MSYLKNFSFSSSDLIVIWFKKVMISKKLLLRVNVEKMVSKHIHKQNRLVMSYCNINDFAQVNICIYWVPYQTVMSIDYMLLYFNNCPIKYAWKKMYSMLCKHAIIIFCKFIYNGSTMILTHKPEEIII